MELTAEKIITSRPYVPIKEAFRVLGISEPTGYRAAKEGRLPFEVHEIGHRLFLSRRAMQELTANRGEFDAAA